MEHTQIQIQWHHEVIVSPACPLQPLQLPHSYIVDLTGTMTFLE